MSLDTSLKLYHTVYRKNEGEDLLAKILGICEKGLSARQFNLNDMRESDMRGSFIFFNDDLQDAENPIIIVETPKSKILVADRIDKSQNWSSSITRYDVWQRNKSRIPYPEYLIPTKVTVEDISGVLYNGVEYFRSDFIEKFGQKK